MLHLILQELRYLSMGDIHAWDYIECKIKAQIKKGKHNEVGSVEVVVKKNASKLVIGKAADASFSLFFAGRGKGGRIFLFFNLFILGSKLQKLLGSDQNTLKIKSHCG